MREKYFDKELIGFATHISRKYRVYPDGYYNSNNGKYRIQLIEEDRDAVVGTRINTPARIGNESGLIILQRSKINSNAFCFFMILWCIAMREAMRTSGDHMKACFYADKVCVEYFLANKKYIGTTIKSMLKMLSGTKSPLNQERAELLQIYLVNYPLPKGDK